MHTSREKLAVTGVEEIALTRKLRRQADNLKLGFRITNHPEIARRELFRSSRLRGEQGGHLWVGQNYRCRTAPVQR